MSPWDKREEANEKKLTFAVANSDHLALLQAYKAQYFLGWNIISLYTFGILDVNILLFLAGMVRRCKEWQPGRVSLLQGELSVLARPAGLAALFITYNGVMFSLYSY